MTQSLNRPIAKFSKYPRVFRGFYNQPWALAPEKLSEIDAFLRRVSLFDLRAALAAPEAEAARAQGAVLAAAAQEKTAKAKGTSVGVIPIFGVISRRAEGFSSGGTSIDELTYSFRKALADESIGAIVLDIDSPGGGVFGLEELGSEIFAARGQKKIIAIADHFAASAAYWLGAQASEFYIAPGGEAGSIGVWMLHLDWSQNLKQEGIAPTFITYGANKAEGNPMQPLRGDTMAHFQSQVDEYGAAFVKAVARGRGVSQAQVREEFGQGRVYGAKEAMARGLVDGVKTLDEILMKLGVNTGAPVQGASSRASSASRGTADKPVCAACGGCGCTVAMVDGQPQIQSDEICPACEGTGEHIPSFWEPAAAAEAAEPRDTLKDIMVQRDEARSVLEVRQLDIDIERQRAL